MMSSMYQNILLGHSESLKFQMIEINYQYIVSKFAGPVGMETAYWFCVYRSCLYMYDRVGCLVNKTSGPLFWICLYWVTSMN